MILEILMRADIAPRPSWAGGRRAARLGYHKAKRKKKTLSHICQGIPQVGKASVGTMFAKHFSWLLGEARRGIPVTPPTLRQTQVAYVINNI